MMTIKSYMDVCWCSFEKCNIEIFYLSALFKYSKYILK